MDVSQHDWITVSGQRAVDYIGRFESVATEFHDICGMLGLNCTFRTVNKTPSREHWTNYFNETTRRRMTTAYAADFEVFGYRHDLAHVPPEALPSLNDREQVAQRLFETSGPFEAQRA